MNLCRILFLTCASALFASPLCAASVVGHPSRNYGWIMARDKTLPLATCAAILKRLAAQDCDPAKFEKVPQLPAQLSASAAR